MPPKPHTSGLVARQCVANFRKEQSRQLRRTMTPAECVLWELLRGHRFRGLKFRRQQVVVGFITDFYCEQLLLALEVDGPIHDRPDRRAYDAMRARAFLRRGIRTVRLRNEQVMRDPVAALSSAIRETPEQQDLSASRIGPRPAAL